MDSSGRFYKPDISGSITAAVTNELGCVLHTNSIYFIQPTYKCPVIPIVLEAFVGLGTQLQWQMDSGNGYENLVISQQFLGVNTDRLLINTPNSNVNGRSFRCRYFSNGYTQYGGETKVIFANKWDGSQSNNWEDTANWTCNSIPNEFTEVSILSGTIQIQSNVTIRKLYVAPGATVTVMPGYRLTIKE